MTIVVIHVIVERVVLIIDLWLPQFLMRANSDVRKARYFRAPGAIGHCQARSGTRT